MSFLNFILPGIGGDVQSPNELGTGGNPLALGGNDRSQLRSLYKLPDHADAHDVLRESKEAGDEEGRAVALAHVSKWQQRKAAALVKQLETRVAHGKAMMGHEARVHQLMAGHGQAASRFALNVGQTREHYQGYEAAFQGALNTIDV